MAWLCYNVSIMAFMQRFGHKIIHHTRSADVFIILASIFMLGVIDLTRFPELPAVIAYEIMLLAVIGAILHVIYLIRQKRNS